MPLAGHHRSGADSNCTRRQISLTVLDHTRSQIRLVYLVFGVIEAVIAIRVILKFLAGNPDAGFTSLVYNLTQPFVALFQGVFPDASSRGSILEVSSLLAILVYALLAFGIASLVRIMGRRQTPGTPSA